MVEAASARRGNGGELRHDDSYGYKRREAALREGKGVAAHRWHMVAVGRIRRYRRQRIKEVELRRSEEQEEGVVVMQWL